MMAVPPCIGLDDPGLASIIPVLSAPALPVSGEVLVPASVPLGTEVRTDTNQESARAPQKVGATVNSKGDPPRRQRLDGKVVRKGAPEGSRVKVPVPEGRAPKRSSTPVQSSSKKKAPVPVKPAVSPSKKKPGRPWSQ